MPARELERKQRRHLRAVRERLVVEPRQLRNNRPSLLRRDGQLGVVRAQMPGHGAGMARFVVVVLGEADREGPDRAIGLGLHQGDHGGGVIPARQQRADRHVGHHALAHGLAQLLLQGVDGVVQAAAERCRP